MATKKIMIVPCAEKIWSKCSGGRYPGAWKASACCSRIMMASENPRSSITSASSVYMTPMRLWSTLVIHSRQRYGRCPLTTTHASTEKIVMPTTPEAIIGSG